MKLHHCGVALALTVVLSTTLGADTLYVRNRPFKGHVSGVGKRLGNITIDLAALTGALGLKVSEVNGNWVVHRAGEEPGLPEQAANSTDKLFVNQKELAYTPDSERKLVSLKDFSDLMQGNLRYNASLSSVDFDLPAAPQAVAGNPTPLRPPGPAYAPPARFQLITFGANW